MLPEKREEPENIDRWLISYADFITLLFTFFVVMYATSTANKDKQLKFEKSVNESLKTTKNPAQISPNLNININSSALSQHDKSFWTNKYERDIVDDLELSIDKYLKQLYQKYPKLKTKTKRNNLFLILTP